MSIEPIDSTSRPRGGLNERRMLPPARAPVPSRAARPAPRVEPRDQGAATRRFVSRLREVLKARRALVVDDDPDFCQTFRSWLTRKGYLVDVAHDGREALASYAERRPDVVFLDVRMPGWDGVRVLKELRALDPEAAVIMVSAVEDHHIVARAKSEGVFYVNKPIDFRYLELAIETTLGLREGIFSSLG